MSNLPRAYLRIDPNLDAHPDPGTLVTLLCYGNRQPSRGRFKTLSVLQKVLGKRRLQAALDREDLVKDGSGFAISGWDIWQEGDLTVGERMKRVRERRSRKDKDLHEPDRNHSVTAPSLNRIHASSPKALDVDVDVETALPKQEPPSSSVDSKPETEKRTDADDARLELHQALAQIAHHWPNETEQEILNHSRFHSSGGGICRIDTCTNPGLLRATAAKVRAYGKPKANGAPLWDRGIDHDVPDADVEAWDQRLGPRPDSLNQLPE